ncbi:hypothetical protein BGZ79_003303 [Entomortierella chlamydospora]|nr:hypothetical protein BGZ79_003303 [Entomortierella chlamydospora]
MLLIKAVFILCSAATVLARPHAYSDNRGVVSAALFFGDDTTESSNPVDIFRNPINHATAASSVLAFSAEQAGFQPAGKYAGSLPQALDLFVTKVSTFPGFYLRNNVPREFVLKDHTTVEEFEMAIKDTNDWEPHIGEIAVKFAELVLTPLNLDRGEAERLNKWTLNLVVIDKPEDSNTVRVQLSRVELNIAFGKDPKTCSGLALEPRAYIPEQMASIVFADFEVNAGLLDANAEPLGKLVPIVSLENTMAILTSPRRGMAESEDRLSAWAIQQKVFSR